MSESEEKALPPTAHKLREARRRGELAKSKELVTAVVTAAGLLALVIVTPSSLAAFANVVDEAGRIEGRPFAEAVSLLSLRLGWAALGVVGPLLLLMVAAAILTNIVANGGVVVSATPILPKLDRIDPVKGLGKLFALRNLFELLKSLMKLAAVLAIAYAVLRVHLGHLAQLPSCGMTCVPGVSQMAFLSLIGASCLVFLLFGLLDIALQRWLFRRDMRMTRTEHKRDRKDSEGDPRLLAHRKKERREAAQLGARTGLSNATFVIQSANDFLAFRYAKPDATVPILVARRRGDGRHQLALEARQRKLPIVFDPEATEAIKRLEVGKMVPKVAFGPIIRAMKAAGVIG